MKFFRKDSYIRLVAGVGFVRKDLLFFILVGMLAAMPYVAFAQSSDKVDAELRSVLEGSDPSELIGIIIIFRSEPTEKQIDTLKTTHKMEIAYVYKIIYGVAGKAPAGEIPKVAQYDWVKEIWLDKKVYATSSKVVQTSKLVEMLQEENDKLRETLLTLNQDVNKLQEQVKAQQNQTSQLAASLKAYSAATFIVGLIVGVVAAPLIKRVRRPL